METSIAKTNENNTKATIQRKRLTRRTLLGLGLRTAAMVMLPLAAEIRIIDANQPLTDDWLRIPIQPRGSTLLGITFRPRNIEAFGLEMRPTLNTLLQYPIQLVRLGASWNRIEPK